MEVEANGMSGYIDFLALQQTEALGGDGRVEEEESEEDELPHSGAQVGAGLPPVILVAVVKPILTNQHMHTRGQGSEKRKEEEECRKQHGEDQRRRIPDAYQKEKRLTRSQSGR